MKKLNKKGFTLIELLAVITIMGILMLLAIPSVTAIIENSRSDTFVTNAKTYANAVKKLWTSDSLYCGSEPKLSSTVVDGDYYILIDTTDETLFPLLESGGKSPWGNRDVKGYVRIRKSEDGKKTKYYVALTDGIHAIYDDKDNPVEVDLIKRQDVIRNVTDDIDILKNIETIPFKRGKYTTCSEESVTWTGTPVEVLNGSGTEVGNEICIKGECFYVISSNSDTVTLFSKYLLFVGGTWRNGIGYREYGDEATGIQNSELNGYFHSGMAKGIVKFSSSKYWYDGVNYVSGYKYNSNSNVYQYVENYKSYLNNFGLSINEARLISREEYNDLRVNYGNPDWLYTVNYWTGSVNGSMIWTINNSPYIMGLHSTPDTNLAEGYGVRPVIVVPRSEIVA